ncbi:CBS domain-containing protein [archaeon]|nr:CBS domain-containing protein [archaeon]
MIPEKTKISEIMSNPVSIIDKNETILDASVIMKIKSIRGLVVVDKDKILGIITERDIVSKVVAVNRNPKKTKIKNVMTHKIVISNINETIDEVANKMYANRIGRILIMDLNDEIVGIVTKTDIIKITPAIIEIFTQKALMDEFPNMDEQTTNETICADCGNETSDLVKVDNRWLCKNCSDDQIVMDINSRDS